MGIKVVTRSCYLGGYIGGTGAQDKWLGEKVIIWEVSVKKIVGVDLWHLQEEYSDMENYLQQDWTFVQHVTPRVGVEFQPVDESLCRDFHP